MRASVYLGNETVELRELDPPRLGENEVLIRVNRAGICGTDLHIFQGHMDNRVLVPLVMGHEMCGEIVECPLDAELREGDRVVVEPTVWCGKCAACRRGYNHICQELNFLGIDSPGAFQEFWKVPLDRVHLVPEELGDEEGALIEPLAVAVHDVRRAGVEVGDQALVMGGGPIGLLVALAARLDGAEVLISEVNPFRVEKAQMFGFRALNPSEEDLGACIEDWTDGAGVDLVFEVSGNSTAVEVMTDLARVRGTICIVGVHPEPRKVDLHRMFWRELEFKGCRVYEPVDFDRAIRIAAAGRIDLKELVSEILPLGEARWGFEQMKGGGQVLKVLLDCQM